VFHPQHGSNAYLFSMTRKKMVEVVGVKPVHICTSSNNTKHARVPVKITGDNIFLPLMVNFKGKANGCIKTTEFVT
jgi:hypothetical protein